MSQKKKLQVFVSSTFEDLKDDRQAAVEAILKSKNIPAGMELFASGDESQMDVIKRWIDQSDIYMLILSGRYGSIEPKTGKSYTQLEFEYAVEKGKALFFVVIEKESLEDRVRKYGTKVIEQENKKKLDDFRKVVVSNVVRFWNDEKDIKIAILETLNEYSERSDLVGWIPANESKEPISLLEEMTRLNKENTELKREISQMKAKEDEKKSKRELFDSDATIILRGYINNAPSSHIYNKIINLEEADEILKFSSGTSKRCFSNALRETIYEVVSKGVNIVEIKIRSSKPRSYVAR